MIFDIVSCICRVLEALPMDEEQWTGNRDWSEWLAVCVDFTSRKIYSRTLDQEVVDPQTLVAREDVISVTWETCPKIINLIAEKCSQN